MRVLQIELHNYKGISALFLDLGGNNLRIAGETGQGKTTATSCLWELLKTVSKPIKDGAKNADIRLVLGEDKPEIIAKRHFTAKTKDIAITDMEGNKVPPKVFESWFSSLGINPHKIMELKPTEQLNYLLKAVEFPQGFNLEAVEEAIQEKSGEISQLEKDIKRIGKESGKEPETVEKVDITELYQEIEARKEKNKLIKDTKLDIQKAVEIREESYKEIDQLKQQILLCESTIKKADNYIEQTTPWLVVNKTQPEEDLIKEVANAEVINEKARVYLNWEEKQEQIQKKEQQKQKTSRSMKTLKNDKKEALDKAVWPIPGISIDSGKITYNGIPLDQCGTSTQYTVCGSIIIPEVKNSKIKAVRMDGIESMSKNQYDTLEKLYNDNGIQVFSSRVIRDDKPEPGETLIHDGGIVKL